MEAPKTWLSAIVRENGLYVQAFIFSCDNGYIANSHIVLTNKKNNKSTIYQMASGDETCLFKYVNKLTPDVSTNYSIKLVVNAYIYSESDIIKFLDTVEFTTPDSWREDVGGDYAVTIEPIVAVGKLSTKPTVKSVISGGEFKDGMRLRICAANSLSTTLDYNSFDAMADFALEDGIYVYNNIFGLGVSGKWYFKAFLALQNNNIISTSNTFEYNVNQGDIEIENLIVGDNVSVVESRMIDTGDFFPPATNMFPFFKTPGSYGVVFNDPPIVGLDETNFNLKVDYVSHDGSGGNGNQDILQTLTTKDGVSYTRRLYHVGQQADMSATDFKMVGSGGSSSGNSTISATPPANPSNGDHWTSTITYIYYTYVSGAWIEL